jgi:hypothetical protein
LKKIKKLFIYLIWTVIAWVIGIAYIWLLIGDGTEGLPDSWDLLRSFFNFALIYVGFIIGSIIALLFILVDVFYLRNQLGTDFKSNLTRFLVLLLITVMVIIVHYILEKGVDVI